MSAQFGYIEVQDNPLFKELEQGDESKFVGLWEPQPKCPDPDYIRMFSAPFNVAHASLCIQSTSASGLAQNFPKGFYEIKRREQFPQLISHLIRPATWIDHPRRFLTNFLSGLVLETEVASSKSLQSVVLKFRNIAIIRVSQVLTHKFLR